MTIKIDAVGLVPYELAPGDEMQVTIDISDWLGTDEIASVAYTAVDGDGVDAAAAVLVTAKHTNTATVVKPFIKGGVDGESYVVKCLVTSDAANADKKAFYVKWDCREEAS